MTNAEQSCTSSTNERKPKRAGFLVAAAVYVGWLIFLLVLGLTQPAADRPAARMPPEVPPSQASPHTPPQGS